MPELVNQVPAEGNVLKWHYNIPMHNLKPSEAFEQAQKIQKLYLTLLSSGHSHEFARNQLLQNNTIAHFASEGCFPRMFLMATSKTDMNAIAELVTVREKVEAGIINEMQGARLAVEIAARAKSKN